ncbi:hypothetical protein E2C01_031291 [Portunus trituberculatus]|uniref:Uncharacterized protein n=1 Tax=Portunus trituberculatus TaxID=210409 RepID=A0A5B7ESK0_PORTR|nr:hypothetical protein [Portunus trituberculatus]
MHCEYLAFSACLYFSLSSSIPPSNFAGSLPLALPSPPLHPFLVLESLLPSLTLDKFLPFFPLDKLLSSLPPLFRQGLHSLLPSVPPSRYSQTSSLLSFPLVSSLPRTLPNFPSLSIGRGGLLCHTRETHDVRSE